MQAWSDGVLLSCECIMNYGLPQITCKTKKYFAHLPPPTKILLDTTNVEYCVIFICCDSDDRILPKCLYLYRYALSRCKPLLYIDYVT